MCLVLNCWRARTWVLSRLDLVLGGVGPAAIYLLVWHDHRHTAAVRCEPTNARIRYGAHANVADSPHVSVPSTSFLPFSLQQLIEGIRPYAPYHYPAQSLPRHSV